MNYFLNYSVYIFFGILPSFLWLQFYLRRDVKPEPKSMILKIFFYGMLLTLPALFFETIFYEKIKLLNLSPFVTLILSMFVGVALVEEFLKFLVVKEKILNDPEFDEPVDAMIYMIIAALGFAAGENLLILSPLIRPVFWGEIFKISLLRFLGATFLHALSSAIIGFFIGLSFFEKQKRGKLLTIGFLLAVLLHGFYNFSIIEMEKGSEILIPFSLLMISAVFISFGFKKLKKIDISHKQNI
ncbi:MAG: PrsW family intramembrane metalloprotease [Candidatus Nealsonbacteria bacterium]